MSLPWIESERLHFCEINFKKINYYQKKIHLQIEKDQIPLGVSLITPI